MTAYNYTQLIKMLERYTKEKFYNKEVAQRLKRIVERENSFMIGMTETFANNLDDIFRYLYLIAYILLLAIQLIPQSTTTIGYSGLSAIIIISLIFMIALIISLILYRKKVLNVDTTRAIRFYFFCRCFKTKMVLENFD